MSVCVETYDFFENSKAKSELGLTMDALTRMQFVIATVVELRGVSPGRLRGDAMISRAELV